MAGRTQVLNLLTPQSSDGFYASNNQFQISGTKGFLEFNQIDEDRLYMRFDFPGVSNENFSYSIAQDKRSISFHGEALQESQHETGGRSYFFPFDLSCGCCELTENLRIELKDGVIRALLQKVKISPIDPLEKMLSEGKDPSPVFFEILKTYKAEQSFHTDGSGRVTQGNPYITKGSKETLEAKPTGDGGLFLKVDLPGVAKEDARVWVMGGEVRFCGKARQVTLQDESGRDYLGSVSLLDMTPFKGKIEHEMKDGVLRILIPPP